MHSIRLSFVLPEAYVAVSAVAEHINNHIKQQDNSIRMLAIQKCLGGHLAPKLIAPGRFFIKEGLLKKVLVVLMYECTHSVYVSTESGQGTALYKAELTASFM